MADLENHYTSPEQKKSTQDSSESSKEEESLDDSDVIKIQAQDTFDGPCTLVDTESKH